MNKKRLMMTEEEVRQRTKELLQLQPEDLLTQYMFQEQEIERLNNIIDNAIKGIEDFYYGDDEYKKYDYTLAYKIYHILKGSDKE